MKSRYSAYKLQLPKYIISTTHKDNIDFNSNTKQWEKEILEFCKSCTFEKLEILEFKDGIDDAYVTFKATIFCSFQDNSMIEKSRFLKEFGKWHYLSGSFLENL